MEVNSSFFNTECVESQKVLFDSITSFKKLLRSFKEVQKIDKNGEVVKKRKFYEYLKHNLDGDRPTSELYKVKDEKGDYYIVKRIHINKVI
jgi:hypothetical protein